LSRKRRKQFASNPPRPAARAVPLQPLDSGSPRSLPAPSVDPVAYGTPWHERRLWQITPVRDAFWMIVVAAVVVFAVWFGYALRAIFTPVLIALALAYLFDPIVSAAERRWRVPRPLTIGALISILLLVGAAFVVWLGPKLAREAGALVDSVPGYIERLAEYAHTRLTPEEMAPVRKFAESPVAVLGDVAGHLLGTAQYAVGWIGNAIGKTTFILVTVALVPLYFFFFAWQFGPLTRYFQQYIPASQRRRTLDVIKRMDAIVATYFRARVVIALMMGVMFSIGWAWAGVRYALLLGMVSGLLSLIPFASIVGWPLAVGLMWLEVTGATDAGGFDWWTVVVWPSAVYLIVQAIESWILTPLIQGRSLDMSPVTILIVVFIGGAVGGLYGLLLCVPLAACIKVLLVELVLPRLRVWAAEN
jgi:predicted PurR-regulated permease PerM